MTQVLAPFVLCHFFFRSSHFPVTPIMQEGNKYQHQVAVRNFKGNVLGYVTPW